MESSAFLSHRLPPRGRSSVPKGMDDPEAALQQIRVQQQQATRAHAQAEALLDSLNARREEVISRMCDLDVTPETVRDRISELESEIQSVLDSIRERIA